MKNLEEWCKENNKVIFLDEWHPTKNGGLTPAGFSYGSGKKIWWKCQYGHEWQATIHNRSRGSGCPKCSGQGTSLPEQGVAFYLEIICKVEQRAKISGKEIDIYLPEYNIGIEYDGKRYHTSRSQNKEKEKDMKLLESGVRLIRIKESDRNAVDGGVVYFDTDYLGANYDWALGQLCRILATATNNIMFKSIQIESQKDILKIYERANRYFKERSLLVLKPDLTKEWHPAKNGTLTPEMFSAGSITKVWWMCSKGHEWEAVIRDRVSGNGCPICSGKCVLKGFNDLYTLNKELAKEWHPTKNGTLKPTDITIGSSKKIWWLCSECGFEWKTSVSNRAGKGTGCPECKLKSGIISRDTKYVLKNGSLAEAEPDIVKEWHPTKNIPLTPNDVARSSCKKVWWLCPKCGNEYQATIGHRTYYNQGCPKCSLIKRGDTRKKNNIQLNGSLFDRCPEIAKEWHPTKNGTLKSTEVARASHYRAWWKCSKCDYEWQMVVYSRTCNGRGCPQCSKR